MARRISEVTHRRGRPAIYPWQRWMDGSAWRIEHGKDFDVPPASMAAMLRNRAMREKVPVRTSTLENAVEFQFFLDVGDEVAA